MRLAGVIAEYNPFHNGHAHHLAETRLTFGASHIVCAMSGHLTQRGEPALLAKHERARAALLGGCDLVLELPASFSAMGAERFAAGGVALLSALGCVDILSFGSECAQTAPLRSVAEYLLSPAFSAAVGPLLQRGMSFAAARQQAVAEALGDSFGALLSCPNDTLGVEYLKAIQRQNAPFSAAAVPRLGAGHDAPRPDGAFSSASAIRRLYRQDRPGEAERFMPEASAAICRAAWEAGFVSDPARLDRAVLSRLRRMDLSDFAALPDVSEGWENRLFRAARRARSLEEFCRLSSSRRATAARARRAAMHAMLSMHRSDLSPAPPYLRILGMNRKGREILGAAAGRFALPVSSSPAKLRDLSFFSRRTVELESAAADLFWLGTQSIGPCGEDFTAKPVILPE